MARRRTPRKPTWIYSASVPLVRLSVVREPEPPGYRRPVITSPENASSVVRPLLENAATEHMVLLPLSTSHKVLGACICGIGSIDECTVSHADILRHVLVLGGRAFLIAHNHPSGDPEPSSGDIEYTRTLSAASKLLSLRFLDHLVVGADRYVSIRDRWPSLFG
jgi:DNA repair protein RadC